MNSHNTVLNSIQDMSIISSTWWLWHGKFDVFFFSPAENKSLRNAEQVQKYLRSNYRFGSQNVFSFWQANFWRKKITQNWHTPFQGGLTAKCYTQKTFINWFNTWKKTLINILIGLPQEFLNMKLMLDINPLSCGT